MLALIQSSLRASYNRCFSATIAKFFYYSSSWAKLPHASQAGKRRHMQALTHRRTLRRRTHAHAYAGAGRRIGAHTRIRRRTYPPHPLFHAGPGEVYGIISSHQQRPHYENYGVQKQHFKIFWKKKKKESLL